MSSASSDARKVARHVAGVTPRAANSVVSQQSVSCVQVTSAYWVGKSARGMACVLAQPDVRARADAKVSEKRERFLFNMVASDE
jgi:hypothetical protein